MAGSEVMAPTEPRIVTLTYDLISMSSISEHTYYINITQHHILNMYKAMQPSLIN